MRRKSLVLGASSTNLSNNFKVHSFDIYDTCITRMFARPCDLFLELGRRVLEDVRLTHRDYHEKLGQIVRQRLKAELKAISAARPREAVLIDDIYKHLTLPHALDIDRQHMMGLELAIEMESAYSVPNIVDRIAEIRRRGHRVVFISDMYLSSNFLRELLVLLGISNGEEPLYVSGEIGLTKRTGRLFDYVLEKERLRSDELLHVGDDRNTDVFPARERGIAVVHWEEVKLRRFEVRIASGHKSEQLIRSCLAGVGRSVRLRKTTDEIPAGNVLYGMVSGAIAPFLTAFTAWVLKRAQSSGIKRLYFAARDGQVLLKIAQALSHYMEVPELRYLYGSRHAWLVPSIDFTCREWQQIVVTTGQANRLVDIIARLGLGLEEIRPVLVRHGFDLNKLEQASDRRTAYQLMSLIIDDPDSSHLIKKRVEESRPILISYLEQEGFNDGQKWALVDSGWRLQCQAALHRIIANHSHISPQTLGYYIALAPDRLPSTSAGEAETFIDSSNTIFHRRRFVVEHLFLASDHPPTIGYRRELSRVVPVFGEMSLNAADLARVKNVHELVVAYAHEIGRRGILESGLEIFMCAAIEAASLLLEKPTREDATVASKVTAVAELRHDPAQAQSLASALGLNDLAQMLAAEIRPNLDYRQRVTFWPEAAAALSSPSVRLVLRTLGGIKRARDAIVL